MLESGDLVQLKSGGPIMTVSWVQREERMVGCQWFDDKNELQDARFFVQQLKSVDGDDA